MGFEGVCTAVYAYAPQGEGELALEQDDLLYILDKNGDDGWWRAKKKAGTDDEDEPEGLVPHNYVDDAKPLNRARAIYEYTRQTDEELSFPEDAILEIFDFSDPDWILAGLDNEYGFVPSNYVEMQEAAASSDADSNPNSAVLPPGLPLRPKDDGVQRPRPVPDVALPIQSPPSSAGLAPPDTKVIPRAAENSGDDALKSPTLPARHRSQIRAPVLVGQEKAEPLRNDGGFHMYNINEMVTIMGKRKKMPTTLGVNLRTGKILIAPEHAQDNAPQEWTADKMTHYSREGKHVFLELVRPSKSIDFHAGAKDTAEEIVGALGDLAAALRAGSFGQELAGSSAQKRIGHMLYDFMAQGDEVTVAAGDEVLILDDTKSDEWWQVSHLKNGKTGVVPSMYIEVLASARSPRSIDEPRPKERRRRASDIENGQSSRSHGGSSRHSKTRSKPESSKVRTWTDRSGSFSVEAQFLGLKDGKIHLHKMNGVKIAVPVAKMSRDDLEYVERATGISLDDDKPLADVKRARASDKAPTKIGATIGREGKPEYDWFEFFLSCDVAVGLCERYAQAFIRDSIDESVLPDVNASILRTLGLREGDIIKVMRFLDTKYGRDKTAAESSNGTGGLLGPGGALLNNTRKGRPAPSVQANSVVDAAAFSSPTAETAGKAGGAAGSSSNRATAGNGFDDAWDERPPPPKKQQGVPEESKESSATPAQMASSTRAAPALTRATEEDLSLLTKPLEPTKVPQISPETTSTAPPHQALQQAPKLTGATPSFFTSMPAPQGSGQASSPTNTVRQRPVPLPTSPQHHNSLVPPPPPVQRPLSAPQTAQKTMFSLPTLVPQMTGAVQGQPAPPGHTLRDLEQVRQQQQYMMQMQQAQPPMMSYMGPQPQALAPLATGLSGQQHTGQAPMVTGIPANGPYLNYSQSASFPTIQSQPTGYLQSFNPNMPIPYQQGPVASGAVNSYLPPALESQRTGMLVMQAQQTGAFGVGAPVAQPLLPQKTGPPPPVRFGVTAESKKLIPQPTGRRANLAQATSQNPFGF